MTGTGDAARDERGEHEEKCRHETHFEGGLGRVEKLMNRNVLKSTVEMLRRSKGLQ